MLAGLYYGAQYGGSTTSILVNLPGEPSAVVTCIDGYQMARQGRAGPALATAALGSFFAGSVGVLLLAAFAPPLMVLAASFGPAEYFSLMARADRQSPFWPPAACSRQLPWSCSACCWAVGTDVNSGIPRFSFGIPD
jgi:TctA family transporter